MEEALLSGQVGNADTWRVSSTHLMPGYSECYACLTMKNIGKPCAGKPHARFDEGGLANAATEWLFRHRQMKRAETDKPNLKLQRPALYSTLDPPVIPVKTESRKVTLDAGSSPA